MPKQKSRTPTIMWVMARYLPITATFAVWSAILIRRRCFDECFLTTSSTWNKRLTVCHEIFVLFLMNRSETDLAKTIKLIPLQTFCSQNETGIVYILIRKKIPLQQDCNYLLCDRLLSIVMYTF